jgi:hypothetical protein
LKKKQTHDSSLDETKLIIEVMENSIIYENFKRFIEGAKVIFSTNQKKASRNRQVQEAHALPESEKEKAESTKLLKKILKSINITNNTNYRTQSLLTIALSSFQKVTYQTLQANQNSIRKEPKLIYSNATEAEKIRTDKKKEESSSNKIGSSLNDQESIYRQEKEATSFLDCERAMVQSIRLSEKVNQSKYSEEIRLSESIVDKNSQLMFGKSGIELEAIIGYTMEQEGEAVASRILFLAVRGFNVPDCLGSPKSQIPGNACQVECSIPKSWRVLSSPYVAVASMRPSNCGNALKSHQPSTESERDGRESAVWPS